MPLAECDKASVVARSAMLHFHGDNFVPPTVNRDLMLSYVRSLRASLVMDVDADCLCGNAGRRVAGLSATHSACGHPMAQNADRTETGDCSRPVPVTFAAVGRI